MKQVRHTYYSNPESEDLMFGDVKAFLRNVPVNDKLLHNILLAISEAFTNALIHGNKWESSKTIEVILAIKDREFLADIIDEGTCNLSFLEGRPAPDPMAEGGRGMSLIENCCESASFGKDENTGGLKVSLRFNLDAKITVG